MFIVLIINSCNINEEKRENLIFNGEYAYQIVAEQVGFGARYSGSPGHAKTQELIVKTLEKNNWEVEIQNTVYDGFPISNIIGKMGEGDPWIIIGVHYDTRKYSDQENNQEKKVEPVLGANDGGSGVGILLEMSRIIQVVDDKEIWLVFFDQEDNGNIDGQDWILGSRSFVDNLDEFPDQVIILDMVGDADLNLYFERNSNRELSEEIWRIGNELGYSDVFIPEYKFSMIDDHTPFLQAGIKAIDIIDFDYPYWHTNEDTLDKVSSESLQIVGLTIMNWLGTIKGE